jgi:hypothetical protein
MMASAARTRTARTTTDRFRPTGLLQSRRLLAAALLIALVACGEGTAEQGEDGGTTPPSVAPIAIPPVDGPYDWEIDPANFVEGVDNPYFPLEPGTVLVYEGHSDGEREVVTVRVTEETKEILGVSAIVVRDTVRVAGEVHEDTFDWYAQDVDGNVWYLGEDTKEYEEGKVVSTEGSWEAGVDGAQPGILLPAHPRPGMTYRQEYYEGEAEDAAEVLSVDERVSVPAGAYSGVLMTRDSTPLEPKLVEHKFYARGVGPVLAMTISGGSDREELLRFRQGG